MQQKLTFFYSRYIQQLNVKQIQIIIYDVINKIIRQCQLLDRILLSCQLYLASLSYQVSSTYLSFSFYFEQHLLSINSSSESLQLVHLSGKCTHVLQLQAQSLQYASIPLLYTN
ncbi:hypothetical protein PPERSA_06008 [Pseudocohnilembus persalinus]|uniref:Uncharacterized protein n=1 Tax=Pseudocohnilembus persalinus TaxID=266149 RepID=A0A0V0QE93_PSEPJ|nr:hypothetical protein PPERSA_06008 [Pseudocohnilembus persalinus]|eukprot:KRX00522.1 hypothetical protein PPERSA_06008 [Pseudocohnilembus persalinus]